MTLLGAGIIYRFVSISRGNFNFTQSRKAARKRTGNSVFLKPPKLCVLAPPADAGQVLRDII